MRRAIESGMLMLVVAAAAGCQSQLHSQLDEDEANRILLVLAAAGLGGEKSCAGTEAGACTVSVPDEQLARAVQATRAAGLPRTRHAGFSAVYRERGLVPGRLEERALFLSALQEELNETLEAIEGVVSARVHATVPVAPAGRRHLGQAAAERVVSAAVLLGYRPGAEGEPPLAAAAVQRLVAKAIDGLEPERVEVVFHAHRPAELLPPAPADGGRPLRYLAGGLGLLAMLGGGGLFLFRVGGGRLRLRPRGSGS